MVWPDLLKSRGLKLVRQDQIKSSVLKTGKSLIGLPVSPVIGVRFATYGLDRTCFFVSSTRGKSEGPKAFEATNDRTVPSALGQADQHAAPASQAGGRGSIGPRLNATSQLASLATSSDRRAVAHAAHLRCLRRGGGQHLDENPHPSVLVRRDVPAVRVNHPFGRSFALEKAHLRGRRADPIAVRNDAARRGGVKRKPSAQQEIVPSATWSAYQRKNYRFKSGGRALPNDISAHASQMGGMHAVIERDFMNSTSI